MIQYKYEMFVGIMNLQLMFFFAKVIESAYVNAVIIGNNIQILMFVKSGLIINNVPEKPTMILKILFIPISFFKIKQEKIVIKKGLTKNKLVASARPILLKEIKNNKKPKKNDKPLNTAT